MSANIVRVAAALAIPIGWSSTFGQEPTPPQEVARRSFASVLMLLTQDGHQQPLSMGSGFFVRPGLVVTNLHVVEGAASAYAKLIGDSERRPVVGVAAIDRARDLILLQVDGAAGRPLPLGDSDGVAVGDTVYAVGNPKGLEGTFSSGIISGIRSTGSDRVLQITAPISPGSSGGPVLNSRGEVIGVSVAMVRDGQNLNFAVPVSYVRSLSERAAPPVALGSIRTDQKEKSILGDLGRKPTESVVGSHFVWLEGGYYTFSVRNSLQSSIRDIDVLVVFQDEQGLPIATKAGIVTGPVGPGLAERCAVSDVWRAFDDVRLLAKGAEIRILGFEVENLTKSEEKFRVCTVKGLTFEVPTSWAEEESEFAIVGQPPKYRLPRAQGETKDYYLVVTYFEKDSSTTAEDSAAYWAKVFGIESSALGLKRFAADDVRVTHYELAGTFASDVEHSGVHPGYRMLAAQVDGSNERWGFRAIGPDETIARSREGFLHLVRSIRHR